MEGGEGFVDAGYGGFVGVDVEVADCVVDELEWVSCGSFRDSYDRPYRCRIFVEQHDSQYTAESPGEEFGGKLVNGINIQCPRDK